MRIKPGTGGSLCMFGLVKNMPKLCVGMPPVGEKVGWVKIRNALGCRGDKEDGFLLSQE